MTDTAHVPTHSERIEDEFGTKSKDKTQFIDAERAVTTSINFSEIDPASGSLRFRNRRQTTEAINNWMNQYYFLQNMQNFCSIAPLLTMNYNSQSQGGITTGFLTHQNQVIHHVSPPSRIGWTTPLPEGVDEVPGREFFIPKLWRRVAAEFIDFCVLFYIKITITLVLMRHMGMIEADRYDLDYRVLFSLDDIDLEKALSFSTEVITLEIINRICTTIIETICLRQGMHEIGGATPGKRLLGLRVVSYVRAIDLPNGKVKIIPADNIGFLSALIRSAVKNFMIAFFFPGLLTVAVFKNKRACYDVLARTIVVKAPGRNII